MKKTGFLILAGIIPLIVVALFMNFISLNLSYSFLIGMTSLFLVSLWQSKNPSHPLLKILIITIPLASGYYFLIVREIQGLWIAIPFFTISTFAGLITQRKKLQMITGIGVIAISALVSFLLVPQIVSNNLSEIINEPAPDFELQNLLTGEYLTNNTTTDKVVVLDFFGTWCAPCIAEMDELNKIKNKLSNYSSEMAFIIACTDSGGDTPEKAIKFHSSRQLPFVLAYDKKSMVHKEFGFSGVPALVIMDKKGKIRFKHEGYNQAEDLQGTLIPLLEGMLDE